MEKYILIQYADIKEEIKDLRRRIKKLDTEIDKLSVVSDSVKGTRKDGTYGAIKITGYPYPAYRQKKSLLIERKNQLKNLEVELMEVTEQAYKFINSLDKSELRIMFRLYYVDNFTWYRVAMEMNKLFPKRRIKYTDENCRKRHDRFFEKI